MSQLSGVSSTVSSISTLRTLSKIGAGAAIVTGYYSAGDGGGGTYYYDPNDTTSTDNGGTIIVANDGGRWKLSLIGGLSIKQFGAVGSGTETTIFKNAFAASGGHKLTLGSGLTYTVSDELVMPDGMELDLNGSTINFTAVGAKRNLAVGNGCEVYGGTINNKVGTSGLQGTYQTPIVAGFYGQLAGVKNARIHDLTINTVTPAGNGIAIMGDSENIEISNIVFPDSKYLGIGVLAHWSFDGTQSTTPYTGTTTHPRNIRIDNIRLGTMSAGTSAANFSYAAVFLSASYNVSVSNIQCTQFTHGAAVRVYAGDWGFQFASATEQAMGLAGITIKNIYGQYLIGAHAYCKNPLQAVSKIWPGSISMENVNSYGINTDAQSNGVRIEGCQNVVVRDSTFDSGYRGVFLGGVVTNITVEGSQIRNSATNGIDGTLDYAGSGALTISQNTFINNNTSATASKADINLSKIAGATIEKNIFNSSHVQWSVRADSACTLVRALDNRTISVGDGPVFSFGYSTDTAVCSQFQGNTVDVMPLNGLMGGQKLCN